MSLFSITILSRVKTESMKCFVRIRKACGFPLIIATIIHHLGAAFFVYLQATKVTYARVHVLSKRGAQRRFVISKWAHILAHLEPPAEQQESKQPFECVRLIIKTRALPRERVKLLRVKRRKSQKETRRSRMSLVEMKNYTSAQHPF
jgi:hypothetical protein